MTFGKSSSKSDGSDDDNNDDGDGPMTKHDALKTT